MTIGLDTSVVLRLLTGTPPDQAEVARALVAGQDAPVAVSDLVIGEAYFALRHHYAVPHLTAVRALREFLDDARVTGTGVAESVLREAVARTASRADPGLVDRLIHACYARDGFALVTFDRALSRLPGVRLLAQDRSA